MTPKANIKIVDVKVLPGLRLEIKFSDGKIQDVDFKSFLTQSRNPEIKKYSKPSAFAKFSLENGDLMWGDFDLIFPMTDLYENRIDRQAHALRKRVV